MNDLTTTVSELAGLIADFVDERDLNCLFTKEH